MNSPLNKITFHVILPQLPWFPCIFTIFNLSRLHLHSAFSLYSHSWIHFELSLTCDLCWRSSRHKSLPRYAVVEDIFKIHNIQIIFNPVNFNLIYNGCHISRLHKILLLWKMSARRIKFPLEVTANTTLAEFWHKFVDLPDTHKLTALCLPPRLGLPVHLGLCRWKVQSQFIRKFEGLQVKRHLLTPEIIPGEGKSKAGHLNKL